jgi:IclR family transcriptional regulator, KDG regulon repressor
MKIKASSGVIDKAVQILDVFAQTENAVGVTELAGMTHLNVSTVYRIACVLTDHGYLRKDEKKGKYTIGLKFLKFNSMLMNKLNVREIAYPFMEKLRTVTGESVNLAILDGNEAVYVEHIESNHMLRTFTVLGNRVPLYCTGVGKVFCAYMDEDTVYHMIKTPFSSYTENTLTDFTRLEKELANIRLEGVALDNGEMDIDVRCIAAPIMDSSRRVAASVSISGPRSRLTEQRIEELKPLVKKYAEQISGAMGFESDSNQPLIS